MKNCNILIFIINIRIRCISHIRLSLRQRAANGGKSLFMSLRARSKSGDKTLQADPDLSMEMPGKLKHVHRGRLPNLDDEVVDQKHADERMAWSVSSTSTTAGLRKRSIPITFGSNVMSTAMQMRNGLEKEDDEATTAKSVGVTNGVVVNGHHHHQGESINGQRDSQISDTSSVFISDVEKDGFAHVATSSSRNNVHDHHPMNDDDEEDGEHVETLSQLSSIGKASILSESARSSSIGGSARPSSTNADGRNADGFSSASSRDRESSSTTRTMTPTEGVGGGGGGRRGSADDGGLWAKMKNDSNASSSKNSSSTSKQKTLVKRRSKVASSPDVDDRSDSSKENTPISTTAAVGAVAATTAASSSLLTHDNLLLHARNGAVVENNNPNNDNDASEHNLLIRGNNNSRRNNHVNDNDVDTNANKRVSQNGSVDLCVYDAASDVNGVASDGGSGSDATASANNAANIVASMSRHHRGSSRPKEDDETSVYSTDTDGFYTSMRADCGLKRRSYHGGGASPVGAGPDMMSTFGADFYYGTGGGVGGSFEGGAASSSSPRGASKEEPSIGTNGRATMPGVNIPVIAAASASTPQSLRSSKRSVSTLSTASNMTEASIITVIHATTPPTPRKGGDPQQQRGGAGSSNVAGPQRPTKRPPPPPPPARKTSTLSASSSEDEATAAIYADLQNIRDQIEKDGRKYHEEDEEGRSR